jgi:hypothetical protein
MPVLIFSMISAVKGKKEMSLGKHWVKIAAFIGIMAAASMLLLAVAQARGANAELLSAMSAVLSVAFASAGIVVTLGLTAPTEQVARLEADTGDVDPTASPIHKFPFASINIIGNGSDDLDFKLDRSGVAIRIAGGNRAGAGDGCSCFSGRAGLDGHQGQRQEAEDSAEDEQDARHIRETPIPPVQGQAANGGGTEADRAQQGDDQG